MTETTIAPAATSATDIPTFRHFIAGEWCESVGGGTFESRNPAVAGLREATMGYVDFLYEMATIR